MTSLYVGDIHDSESIERSFGWQTDITHSEESAQRVACMTSRQALRRISHTVCNFSLRAMTGQFHPPSAFHERVPCEIGLDANETMLRIDIIKSCPCAKAPCQNDVWWGDVPHIVCLWTRWKWVVSFKLQPVYLRYLLERKLNWPYHCSERDFERKHPRHCK
jgi:hypothetical protein